MTSPSELSQRYIDCHNRQDLDGLLALVDEDIDFKRSGDEPLHGRDAVRRQYEADWSDHAQVLVTVTRMLEAGAAAAIEIHVDAGPPSNVEYDGLVVHDWGQDGRLIRYRLYVDEGTPKS